MGGLGAARGGSALRRGDRRERLQHPQHNSTRGSYPVGLRVTERRSGGERRRRSGRARPHPGAARGGQTSPRRGGLQGRLHLPHSERGRARPPPGRGRSAAVRKRQPRRPAGASSPSPQRERPSPPPPGGGPRRARKRQPRRPAGASSPSPRRDKFSLMEAAQRQRRYKTAGEPSRTKPALLWRHHPSPPCPGRRHHPPPLRPAPAAPAAPSASGLIRPKPLHRGPATIC